MVVNNNETDVDSVLALFRRTTEEVFTFGELRKRMLSGKQIVMKYGVDLTAPDLHIGHAVNLWMYRRLQELGHKVVLLLGDFTTTIGDPTGKSKTRPVLADDVIAKNRDAILAQALQILSDNPEVLEIRRNSEWLGEMKLGEFLGVLSQITVGQLLTRDMFRRRMDNSEPIAGHEFLYPVLQGWDSVALDADLTIIGSDQLFNEMVGRTLQEKAGQSPQVVLTTKITPGLDGGEKQSKSLGNYVAVGDSARDKFGKLMSLLDELIVEWAYAYTDLTDFQIEELAARVQSDPRSAKADLATAVVTRYHGPEVAAEEADWFRRTFSEREVPEDAPAVVLATAAPTVLQLARALEPSRSGGEIRRLIQEGGLQIDGAKIVDLGQTVTLTSIPLIVKVGARKWFKVSLADNADQRGG